MCGLFQLRMVSSHGFVGLPAIFKTLPTPSFFASSIGSRGAFVCFIPKNSCCRLDRFWPQVG